MNSAITKNPAAEHTPGPWGIHEVKSSSDNNRVVYCLIGNPKSVPNLKSGVAFAGTYMREAAKGLPTTGDRISQKEALANASLIAASPDLLAAIKELVAAIANDQKAENNVRRDTDTGRERKAVANAIRSNRRFRKAIESANAAIAKATAD